MLSQLLLPGVCFPYTSSCCQLYPHWKFSATEQYGQPSGWLLGYIIKKTDGIKSNKRYHQFPSFLLYLQAP